jgi:hypothetical protein
VAVRKYAISERLPQVTSEIVDEVVAQIKNENGDQFFDPKIYLDLMVYSLIGTIAFGEKLTIKDKDFRSIQYFNDKFHSFGDKIALADLIPIMKYPLWSTIKQFKTLNKQFRDLVSKKFSEHLISYEDGIIRDFADALIAAKNEALKEGKESAPYLKDVNLALSLWDLFVAGSKFVSINLVLIELIVK